MGDRSWVIPLKMPDSPPNGNRPNAVLRMKTEAVKAGFYESPHHGKFPKIQILTVEELFRGKKPKIPFVDGAAFKTARREETTQQGMLL
jgi:hypothetical protein